ncbi:MAG: tetratricopeptide repeat protein [bacterium]
MGSKKKRNKKVVENAKTHKAGSGKLAKRANAGKASAPQKGKQAPLELPGARLPWWAAALIIITVATLPFLNTFENKFVSYDDEEFIVNNSAIRKLDARTVVRMIESYIPGREHIADFPLTQITWAINYKLGGYNTWGYHFGNLLFHVIACLLLFALFLKGPWGRAPALWGALLFAAHPAHVESVTWMTCRKDVLSAAFGFAAMIVYIRFARERRAAVSALAYIGAAFLWILSLFAKPVTIAVPPLLAAWFLFAEPGGRRAKGLIGLLPYVPMTAIFMWSQVIVSQERHIVKAMYFGGSFAMTQLTTGYVLLRYAQILAFPANLCAKYPLRVPTGLDDHFYTGCWLIVIAAAIVLLFMARRRPGILFFPLWILIALAPVLQLIPTAGNYADRYLYIPSAAFCLGVALLAGRLANLMRVRIKNAAQLAAAVLAVIVVVYSTATASQNRVWRDSETLWPDTIKKNPANGWAMNDQALIYYNKGLEYQKANRTGAAAEQFRFAEETYKRCIEADPTYITCYVSLSGMYDAHGRYGDAIVSAEKGEKYFPDNKALLENLMYAYLHTGEKEKIIPVAEKIVKQSPDNVDMACVLCEGYAARGNLRDALPHCEKVVATNSRFKSKDLGIYVDALIDAGRYSEAVVIIEETLKKSPDSPAEWIKLGKCRQGLGQPEKAAEAWKRALALDPGNAEAKGLLSQTGSKSTAD